MTGTLENERKEMQETLERIKAESKDPLIGKVLNGGHTIIRPLGSGGMGAVYLAYDFDLGQKVVVKILQPQLADEEALKDRFQQEARVLVEMRHPAIPVVNYLDKSGPWFLVMEFCEGDSLADYFHHNRERRTNKAFQRQLIEPLFGVIDALALAHSKGIIHRDIKPENIMVQQTGTGELSMKLIDFGIAKASRRPAQTIEGSILGTLGYLSPEQLMGRTVTKLSDVYSLGAVLYEVFAGAEFIQPSDNMLEMTGRAMNVLYVQERLKLLPVHIRALIGLMLEMQAKDRLGGMYEVEGGLKYIRSIMEIEEDGGQIDGNELDISMELTSSKKVDGNLEILGVQRVMKRQLEVKRSNVMVTAEVPAIQESQGAPAFQPPASGLPSMDVSISSLLGPPVSNPDYRVSDLGIQVQQQVPVQSGAKSSMAEQPAISIHAEPGAGTILGVGGRPSGQISVVKVPSQCIVSAEAAVPTQAEVQPEAPHESTERKVRADEPTVEAPMPAIEEKHKAGRSLLIPIGAGFGMLLLVLSFFGILHWSGKNKKKPDSADAHKTSVAQVKLSKQTDASVPAAPAAQHDASVSNTDSLVQADAAAPAAKTDASASVQHAPPTPGKEKTFDETYKSLEEICKKSERGQKFWIVPNFRAYCTKTEAFKLDDLELQLKVLRYNKYKYCRKHLKQYERALASECASHDAWIRKVTDRIWVRDHPNWRPPPMRALPMKIPPRKTPSKKPPPRPKPRR